VGCPQRGWDRWQWCEPCAAGLKGPHDPPAAVVVTVFVVLVTVEVTVLVVVAVVVAVTGIGSCGSGYGVGIDGGVPHMPTCINAQLAIVACGCAHPKHVVAAARLCEVTT